MGAKPRFDFEVGCPHPTLSHRERAFRFRKDRHKPHARSSRMKLLRTVLLTFAFALAAPAQATHDDLRTVTGLRDHFRALLVFTPSLADARLTTQRAIMAQLAIEAAKRDLVLVQIDPTRVIGLRDSGDSLRRRFHVPVTAYHALLLDKDGRVLLEASGPVEGAAIVRAIDRTPLRQLEVQRARSGHPLTNQG